MSRRYSLFMFGLLAGLLSSCSRSPATVQLAGRVTVSGKVLQEGVVLFYPADKEGASPLSVPIVDGRYLAPAIPSGTYRAAFRTGSTGSAEVRQGPVDSSFAAPTLNRRGPQVTIPNRYQLPSWPVVATTDNHELHFDLTW